jgi:hypothetical protein
MEMASFLNGQNNNGSNNSHQGPQQNHVAGMPVPQLHQDANPTGGAALNPPMSEPPPLLQTALPIEQPL